MQMDGANMIKLHDSGPNFGLSDASPFVTKVETLLRMAKIRGCSPWGESKNKIPRQRPGVHQDCLRAS
jgi:hypothetical protein